jgi:hypothetical protein
VRQRERAESAQRSAVSAAVRSAAEWSCRRHRAKAALLMALCRNCSLRCHDHDRRDDDEQDRPGVEDRELDGRE